MAIDTMDCQVKIAQEIIDKKGDYLLAVKRNQGRLNEVFNQYFNVITLSKYAGLSNAIEEKSHGRNREKNVLHL